MLKTDEISWMTFLYYAPVYLLRIISYPKSLGGLAFILSRTFTKFWVICIFDLLATRNNGHYYIFQCPSFWIKMKKATRNSIFDYLSHSRLFLCINYLRWVCVFNSEWCWQNFVLRKNYGHLQKRILCLC